MKKFTWHFGGAAGTSYRTGIGCAGQQPIQPTYGNTIDAENEDEARAKITTDRNNLKIAQVSGLYIREIK